MREIITFVICLFLFFVSLQIGLIRTGNDYETLSKQVENLQKANDRLSDEIKRATTSSANKPVMLTPPAQLIPEKIDEGTKNRMLQMIQADLGSLLEREIKNGNVEIKFRQNQLVLRIRDQVLFTSVGGKLLPSGKMLLGNIAQALRGQKNLDISIIGHTDVPGNFEAQPEKISELRKFSLTLAQDAADYLQNECNLDPVQVLTGGYGPYRPIVPNDNYLHRAQNRRLEICLQPVDSAALYSARQIVEVETHLYPGSRAKKNQVQNLEPETTPKAIGAEELNADDTNHFDAGYEKPGE